MSEENHNLNLVSTLPKASGWNKWKILAVANSIVIIALTIAMINYVHNFKIEMDKSHKIISNHGDWIFELATQDEFHMVKTFDLHVTTLQYVNPFVSVEVIKAAQFIDGQKLTIGILNTSGAGMSDITMKITKVDDTNDTGGIDLNYLNKIPSGFMGQTTVVLPKDYVGQNLGISFIRSNSEFQMIP
ncbi:hypothetical protein [Sulfuricurvum sp.]|uniref:hypothetical protein n=1 Tax=Sulfuricurvum sp. TaxID=2025608 RepID=UPI003C64C06D